MEKPPRPPRPEQENFGEATPGEAQSENPPTDPEMVRETIDEPETSPDESSDTGEGIVPDDQDAEPTKTSEELEKERAGREQAEGE